MNLPNIKRLTLIIAGSMALAICFSTWSVLALEQRQNLPTTETHSKTHSSNFVIAQTESKKYEERKIKDERIFPEKEILAFIQERFIKISQLKGSPKLETPHPSDFTLQPSVEPSIPDRLYPCLPKTVKRVELLGRVQQRQESFYLLGAFVDSDYWELLAKTDAAGCLLVKFQYDSEPLSAYVPMETARQLVLQQYQRRIEEAGGLQAFQRGLTEHLAQTSPGEILYLAPERVWALEQLGVEIPEGSYQILQPGTVPAADKQRFSR